MAKCVECRNASWQRTPTGRIKRQEPGRCLAEVPRKPVLLCDSRPDSPVSKTGIWRDMEGTCDFFETLTETQVASS